MSRHRTSTRASLAALIVFGLCNLSPLHWIGVSAQSRIAPSSVASSDIVSGVVINEVDSDQVGADTAEFVELYDGGAGNTPLDGYVVVFFNGGDDASYAAFDLDGFSTNAGGYFTLGNAAVPGVDVVFANARLQNGTDAVALFSANAANFPTGTAVTTVSLVDALVYDNGTAADAGLLVLLNAAQSQVNENRLVTGTTVSMQRIPNGLGGERNTNFYQVFLPTPDGPNFGPTVAPVSLSGRVTDAAGNGIRGSRITIEGGGISAPRSAITSSFGNYSFDGLATGMYMVTIDSKRHSFAIPTRVISLVDNVTDFDFVAEPLQ